MQLSLHPQDLKSELSAGQARIYLLGLDFGSTTSSALIASAMLTQSASGRMQFSEIRLESRCEPVFTLWLSNAENQCNTLDIARITDYINTWLTASQIAPEALFSGGAIITGLAAQASNTAELRALVKSMIGDSVIATADDPSLESWLAFMGSCAALSRHHADLPLLNLDIGGGTTNAAIGINGDVVATACYFIGARHFQFVVGSYQLTAISRYGQALLDEFAIDKKVGESLTPDEIDKILQFYVAALEAIALNQQSFFTPTLGKLHTQVALNFELPSKPIITFSGGVGELLYQHMASNPLPSTTYFGDLGIALARAIAASPILNQDLASHVPENQGRATVYGLTFHNTEISGRTLFLPKPEVLPLSDLAIVAKLSLSMAEQHWHNAFCLAANQTLGACLQMIDFDSPNVDDIRQLAAKIQQHVAACEYPAHQPLVILLEGNIGKALGQYCSNWGTSLLNLIVLDEVPLRHAQFVHIGKLKQDLLAVSFFGMH